MEKRHNILKIQKPTNEFESDISNKHKSSKNLFTKSVLFGSAVNAFFSVYCGSRIFEHVQEIQTAKSDPNYFYLAAVGLLFAAFTAISTKISVTGARKSKIDMNFHEKAYELLSAAEELYKQFGMSEEDILSELNSHHKLYKEHCSDNDKYWDFKNPKFEKCVNSNETVLSILCFHIKYNLVSLSNDKEKVEKILKSHPAFKDWFKRLNELDNRIEQTKNEELQVSVD